MTQVLANATSQGYSSTLAADLSNSVNTALMFTISCQNHACNRETISHFQFQIVFAMMKNSGTKLSSTHKKKKGGEHDFRVDIRRKKSGKNKTKNSSFLWKIVEEKNSGERIFLWILSRTSQCALNNRSYGNKKELPEWTRVYILSKTQRLRCQGSSAGCYHSTLWPPTPRSLLLHIYLCLVEFAFCLVNFC